MTQRRIYQDEFPYFVTFRTSGDNPFFEETKYAALLSSIIFQAGKLKGYDILSYQIMPDHVHLLVYKTETDRTLDLPAAWLRQAGSMRSADMGNNYTTERTLSRVRSRGYTVSDLLQSIKGNFSRQIHHGNIWQKRFYTRIINTHKYLETAVQYIKHNPVKASLPKKYHRAPYQYFNWPLIKALF
ncbi:MAG: transposase [Patescibacteria group bacterium]